MGALLVLLRDHYERLATSAKILTMGLPKSTDELAEITVELCLRNRFESHVYIRPFSYKAAEDVGVRLHNVPDGLRSCRFPSCNTSTASVALHVCVSSWRRADDTMAPPRAKITGLYVNSALAKSEAVQNGYDEAILLSHDGHVAEGSAENIFLVRRGVLYTPDPSQNVLEGVTRRVIMEIARDELGLTTSNARSIAASSTPPTKFSSRERRWASVRLRRSIGRQVGDGEAGPITRAAARRSTKAS